ncbi:hypothetical protein EDC94DRAFT_589773 [Helicostylum pulchrum]|nr:hypothetical protein EDC94DRAFT_589773 [Helicostylum pulchrum]
MARLSNRKKSMIQNLRKARGVAEIINVDSEDLTVVDVQPVEIVEETTVQSVNFILKDDEISRKTPFSRGLKYTVRHQRKLNQKNREMASGRANISSYFNVATPVAEEAPAATEMETMQAAYDNGYGINTKT